MQSYSDVCWNVQKQESNLKTAISRSEAFKLQLGLLRARKSFVESGSEGQRVGVGRVGETECVDIDLNLGAAFKVFGFGDVKRPQ
jgi:hypothetical protein